MTIKKTHHPFLVFSVFLAMLMLLLAVKVSAASLGDATVAEPTPGLQFSPSASADSYSITAYTGTSTEIVIPST